MLVLYPIKIAHWNINIPYMDPPSMRMNRNPIREEPGDKSEELEGMKVMSWYRSPELRWDGIITRPIINIQN